MGQVKIAKLGPKCGYPERIDPQTVRPGQQYMVLRRIPAAAGMPATAPAVEATVVERRGPHFICTISEMVPSPVAVAEARARGRFVTPGEYRPGRRTIRVAAADVICPAQDWKGKQTSDGRTDAPVVTHAAGRTFTEERMVLA